jgi:hypothetical protein
LMISEFDTISLVRTFIYDHLFHNFLIIISFIFKCVNTYLYYCSCYLLNNISMLRSQISKRRPVAVFF